LAACLIPKLELGNQGKKERLLFGRVARAGGMGRKILPSFVRERTCRDCEEFRRLL
jgi:hypothetical protein